MAIFYLKYRDTRPILEVLLQDEDPDNPGSFITHDLTGASEVHLHILLNDGNYLTRAMAISSPATAGRVTYTWAATDWDAGSGGTGTLADPYTVGGLIEGPAVPLAVGAVEHRMEYEVLGPDAARMTFPNGGPSAADRYDTLRIAADLGQATL